MKRFAYFLLFFLFNFSIASAQAKPSVKSKKPTEKKSVSDKNKKSKKTTAAYSKAGKSDPNEKGSGLVVPDRDKPKLDDDRNPAATVPTTNIPLDNPNP